MERSSGNVEQSVMRGHPSAGSDFDVSALGGGVPTSPIASATLQATPPPPGAANLPPPPAFSMPQGPPTATPAGGQKKSGGLSPGAKWGIGLVATILCLSLAIFGVRIAQEVSNLAVIDDLEVGDCVENHFQSQEQAEEGEFFSVMFVSRVSCSQTHAYEMYAKSTTLWDSGAAYPGVDAVFQDGEQFCRAQYDEFVGGDYFTSPYDFFVFVPPDQVWADGGRDVRCLVGYADGVSSAIGTLEGAGWQTAS